MSRRTQLVFIVLAIAARAAAQTPPEDARPSVTAVRLEPTETITLDGRLDEAVAQNVAFVPGAPFYANTPESNTLRLSFVTVPPEKIREGIAKLGKLIAAKM